LEGTPATTSVIANEDTSVYVIEAYFLNVLFQHYPELAGRFFLYLAFVLAQRMATREKDRQLSLDDKKLSMNTPNDTSLDKDKTCSSPDTSPVKDKTRSPPQSPSKSELQGSEVDIQTEAVPVICYTPETPRSPDHNAKRNPHHHLELTHTYTELPKIFKEDEKLGLKRHKRERSISHPIQSKTVHDI